MQNLLLKILFFAWSPAAEKQNLQNTNAPYEYIWLIHDPAAVDGVFCHSDTEIQWLSP